MLFFSGFFYFYWVNFIIKDEVYLEWGKMIIVLVLYKLGIFNELMCSMF